MNIMLNIIIAVIPTFLTLLCLQSLYRHRKQAKEIWITFGMSLLFMFFVTIILVVLGIVSLKYNISNPLLYDNISNPLIYSILWAFLVTAIPEEIFRMLLIKVSRIGRKPFGKLMDGMIFGSAASLGFATVENLLEIPDEDIYTALGGIIVVLLHSMIGAIMGYHLAKSRFNKKTRYKEIAIALLIPIGLHSLYNFPGELIDGVYYSGSNMWVPMHLFLRIVSLSTLFIAFRLVKRRLYHAREELKEEIFGGTEDSSISTLKVNERFM